MITKHELKHNIYYYVSIFIPIFLNIIIFWIFNILYQDLSIDSTFELIVAFFKIFWFTGILFSTTNIIGFLLYGHPDKKNNKIYKDFLKKGWNDKNHLVIVYVSKGENAKALMRSVNRTLQVFEFFESKNIFVNFNIEIVTDIPIPESLKNVKTNKIDFYVVDKHYETKNKVKHKARALQYLLEHSKKRTLDSWILHFDEESALTKYAVAGIDFFIRHTKSYKTIGQGEIIYNSYNYAQNKLITLMDSVRTGDDLGRFRLQYRFFKLPLFGMHGSFFLVNNRLEKEIGFDQKGPGSIVEDAYFALKSFEKKVRFKWIYGYIREQSPFTIKDIIAQRRRWFSGLLQLCTNQYLSFRVRIMLIINSILWALSWIGPVVTLINVLVGGTYFPILLSFFASLITGVIGSVYLVGAYRNISTLPITLSFKQMYIIYVLALFFIPVASMIEGYAIIYSFFKPVKGFHIVNKN